MITLKKLIEAVTKPVFTQKDYRRISNKLMSTFITIPPHPMHHGTNKDVMSVDDMDKINGRYSIRISVDGTVKDKVKSLPTEVMFRWIDDGTFKLVGIYSGYPEHGDPPKFQPKTAKTLEEVRQMILAYMKEYYDHAQKAN